MTYVGSDGSANAALAFLHDDHEDEALVNASLARDLANSSVDGLDLVVGVVGSPAVPAAGVLHDGRVSLPESIISAPLVHVGPAMVDGTVTSVELVAVGNSTALLERAGGRLAGGKSRSDGCKSKSSEGGGSEHFCGVSECYCLKFCLRECC